MRKLHSLSKVALASTMLLTAGTGLTLAIDRNNEKNQSQPVKAPVYESPVVKLRHGQGGKYDYVPNEVIVKFKDSSGVSIHSASNGMFRTSSVRKVDNKLAEIGIVESTQLMPLTGAKKMRKGAPAKSIYGKPVEEPDMSRLYLFKVNPDKQISVETVVEELNALDEVEYAHPNYRLYALVEQAPEPGHDHNHEHNDPLKGDQYAHDAINLPELWAAPIINDERPIIAIIDTGVDTEHPDLQANIWTNPSESDGSEWEDDDLNGFVDDIHGWDFVDKTPIMSDPNGHGTHCAGIAAAVGNNGIGITGANPDALIMPIRVMEPDGTGSTSVIIQGIDYAVANGADVISMSFGGGGTIGLYEALQKAYQNSILVAAAGNDKKSIYERPLAPAVYDVVLGVQASDKQNKLASFSNYDPDGAFYSKFSYDWYNYEIIAPGDKIMSTYPGGKYKNLSGTSMATPLVAGSISRLLQTKPELYRDTWIGDITHAINEESGIFDAYRAYTFNEDTRQIALALLSIEIDDKQFGDGDGDLDAGEIVELYPTLRSEWGHAMNIKMNIGVDSRYESASSIEVLSENIDFGYSLNSRGVGKSANPIKIKINSELNDGHYLKLIFTATCDNIYEDLTNEVGCNVVNGVEIGGMIDKDLTLYPNVHYIVTSPLAVPDNVKLTILPGTVINFRRNTGLSLSENAILECVGEPGNMISFICEYDDNNTKFKGFDFSKTYNNQTVFKRVLKYCILKNICNNTSNDIKIPVENCILSNFDTGEIETCYFRKCNIINNYIGYYSPYWDKNRSFYTIDNEKLGIYNNFGSNFHTADGTRYGYSLARQCSSNFFNITAKDQVAPCIFNSTSPVLLTFEEPNYFGTSREDIARERIRDIENPFTPTGFGKVDLSNMLIAPHPECHGVVWKVVVNGYDAQDEYELMPPLGVGKHKFEVYFNRPMNKAKAPTIAMGAQEPYNQIPISEDGSWNEEGTIYTAYITITGKSNCDGVNRIYVAEAEDDEFFEIPLEDYRFNVNVQSAGSLSTGLMAEAGLGKVNLTWETDEEDFEDLLGYNIHRYTMINDSETSDTIVINRTLIDSQDQAFTDYDVVPGITYYYQIKQLTTSFNSHNLSNPVAATPLTATKGDANGSMSVDVADVVTEVAYMTNQNPQPFIFEAADVNADLAVNVLDVVGTVNIIRNPKGASTMSINSTATYTIEDGILYVDSDVALGGVQFRIEAGENAAICALEALSAFELVKDYDAENGWLVMAYSMTGKTVSIGKQALLRIGDAKVTEAIFSDSKGQNVMAICGDTSGVGSVEAMQMQMPYPNPFSDVLNIPYVIGQEGSHKVSIQITTPSGLRIASHNATREFGYYNYTWRPTADNDEGIYFVSLYVDDRLMQTARVILRR